MYYDKQIRYIDYLENGEKQRNCGYIKITVTDHRLLMDMQIKGLYETDDVASEVVLEGAGAEVRLATVLIRQGSGSFQWEHRDPVNEGEALALGQELNYGQLERIRVQISPRRSLWCTWREPVSGQSASRQSIPKQSISERSTPRQNASDQSASEWNTPGQNASGQGASEWNKSGQNASEQSASEWNTPVQSASEQDALGQSASEWNKSGQNASEQSALEWNMPGQNTSEQSTSEWNTPVQSASERDVLGQSTSEWNTPGQNASGQDALGQSASEWNTPGQNASEQSTLEWNKSGQNASEQSTSEWNRFGQNASGQSSSGQNTLERKPGKMPRVIPDAMSGREQSSAVRGRGVVPADPGRGETGQGTEVHAATPGEGPNTRGPVPVQDNEEGTMPYGQDENMVRESAAEGETAVNSTAKSPASFRTTAKTAGEETAYAPGREKRETSVAKERAQMGGMPESASEAGFPDLVMPDLPVGNSGNRAENMPASQTGNGTRQKTGSQAANALEKAELSQNNNSVKHRTDAATEKRRPVPGSQTPSMASMSEDKWQQLLKIYPHIRPFQDEREYLSLRPEDFVILHSNAYRLVQNSFLLHGYFNYDHLILAQVSRRNGNQYYIGVPGNFYEKEKQVAIMYGFSSFECRREPAEEGDFGYYMIKVEL